LAERQANKGEIVEALSNVRSAITLDASRSDAWYELGSVLGQLGDFPGAQVALRQAIHLRPDFAKAHYELALTFVGNPQGEMDWASAISECKEALKSDPNNARALSLMGAGLVAIGQMDAAVPTLKRALDAAPTLPEAHFNLGIALEGKGDLDSARQEFEAAIRERDAYPEAVSALGNLLFRMKQSEGAERELDKALRLNPDLTAAHYTLAKLLRSLGREADAAVEFAETKDLTRRPEQGIRSSRLSNDALGIAAKGDLAAATKMLHDAINLKPDYGVPDFNLGLVLADAGDTGGALGALAKSISLLPGQAKPWFEYGRVMRATNNRKALAALAWAARLAPDDPAIRAEIASDQASVPRDATTAVQEPAARPEVGASSDDESGHLMFAQDLQSRGDFLGAVGELLRALTLEPASIPARHALAQNYESLGDREHAVLEYYKLVRCAPADGSIHIELGKALFAQGHVTEAISQFRQALSLLPQSVEAETALRSAEAKR
jgi:tetratricopeptide (TPR) repeat protein